VKRFRDYQTYDISECGREIQFTYGCKTCNFSILVQLSQEATEGATTLLASTCKKHDVVSTFYNTTCSLVHYPSLLALTRE
jgi:hypothetical protein